MDETRELYSIRSRSEHWRLYITIHNEKRQPISTQKNSKAENKDYKTRYSIIDAEGTPLKQKKARKNHFALRVLFLGIT